MLRQFVTINMQLSNIQLSQKFQGITICDLDYFISIKFVTQISAVTTATGGRCYGPRTREIIALNIPVHDKNVVHEDVCSSLGF